MTIFSAPLVTAVLIATSVLIAPPAVISRSGTSVDVSSVPLGQRLAGLLRGRREVPAAVTTDEVIESLVLLALGYRSGLPTSDVLEAVAARVPERPGHDLRQVAAALRWGASEADAWGSVSAAWASVSRAVALAHSAGVAPGPLLLRAADDLGLAQLERLEVAAAKVAVRLVLPLGLVLLPAFVLTTVLPIVAALARQVLSAS